MDDFNNTLAASTVISDAREHPFFPIDAYVPDYVATSTPTAILLTIFFGTVAAILALSKVSLTHFNRNLSNSDLWTTSWFILCGFIHTFFEGYFSYHFLNISSRTDLFGQLWKEYALSDSRYMTRDSFVVCMESVTAYLWGPLSFLCAYYIIINYSLRQPLQLIISVGQLYGLLLYYGTCAFEELVHGVVFSRPEKVYFCIYFVICNAFWLFIPGWLIYQSVLETAAAFEHSKIIYRVGIEKQILSLKDSLNNS